MGVLMKKKLLIVMSLICCLVFASCSNNNDKKDNETQNKTEEKKEETSKDSSSNDKKEETVVKWNYGTSGNVLVTIAEQKGFFKDEGIKIEPVFATENADALSLLASDKVDVVSNAGTSNPLQQISAGVDLTIFGGHMLNGAMPVIAKKGTKWNGITDLVGKKAAINPQYYAFTGALMDAGVKDPLKEVDWVQITKYNDAMAAVVRGDVDYALLGTQQNQAVKNMKDIEVVTYQSDVMPNYSCCRLVTKTKYINENPDTIKAILRALIRAQQYYESNKEEAVHMLAKQIKADDAFVAAYMLDEHYDVHIDPLKKGVIRAWDILGKTNFLDAKAKTINIEDKINTDLYKQALEETKEKYGKEDPKFYESLEKFFEENDK